MKKKLLMAFLALATVVGGAPVTPYAAQLKVVQVYPGEGYRMISGEDDECVQQILDQLNDILNNAKSGCQNISDYIPEIPQPEIPQPEEPQQETPQPQPTETPQPTATPKPQPTATPKPQPTATPKPEPTETHKPGTGETVNPDLSIAEQITKLVNAERAKEGLPAVELNADITAAANVRAREIKQQFAHTRPDGRSFSTALTDRGITYWGCGENIAYGQRSAEEVMTGWMNSSGHRANIMNRSFNNIGVGYYQDERGVKYWVQLFTY